MNYLRSVVSDVKFKYRASRVVSDCIAKRERPEFTQYLTECVNIADGHPQLVLSTLHEYLSFRQPENAYGGLLLLEQLVSLCNYGFHLALAKDDEIQDRIIQLAVKRGEGEAHRKAQRLARLTLLEYSRVFVDDRELLRLSSLASSFEHRTSKNLLRCLNVQNRRVRFRDVGKDDIIPISPKESLGSTSSSALRAVTPLRLSSAPEVWPCHVCTYLNAPSATRCAACETLRSMDSVAHHATPQVAPKTTSKMCTQPQPPTPPHLNSSPSSSPDEEDAELDRVNGNKAKEEDEHSDTYRHHNADLSIPPSDISHAGPPAAAVFHNPTHLKKEDARTVLTDISTKMTMTASEAPILSTHTLTKSNTNEEEVDSNDASNKQDHTAGQNLSNEVEVQASVVAIPYVTEGTAGSAAEAVPPAEASLNSLIENPLPHSPEAVA